VLGRKPDERRKVVKTELLHHAVARLQIGQPSGPIVACRGHAAGATSRLVVACPVLAVQRNSRTPAFLSKRPVGRVRSL